MFSAAAFVLFFLACAVLALARSPLYGLGLYLAVFYIHPPSRWWGSMLPDLRWSLLAAVIALLAVVVGASKSAMVRAPGTRRCRGWRCSSSSAWFWIQNLWALDPERHFDASVQLDQVRRCLLSCLSVGKGSQSCDEHPLFTLRDASSWELLCHLQGRELADRLDGVGGPGIDDANSLGMYLATGVVVGGMLLLASTGWRRRVALFIALPVILNGLILTGSRGAFLGLSRRWCRSSFCCARRSAGGSSGLCALLGVVAA